MNDDIQPDAIQSDTAHEAQIEPDAEPGRGAHHAEAEAKADRAAEGLRDQIAALRQQVRDAQETLKDHQRRRETRPAKR